MPHNLALEFVQNATEEVNDQNFTAFMANFRARPAEEKKDIFSLLDGIDEVAHNYSTKNSRKITDGKNATGLAGLTNGREPR